jgi:ParB family chromosome partitioning protein
MTHQGAAESVGRSRAAVSNLLRLLNLAKPVQAMISAGDLDMGHGRALVPLSAAKQVEAAGEIVKRGLSVREAERLVARLLKPASRSEPRPRIVTSCVWKRRSPKSSAPRCRYRQTAREPDAW